MVSQVGPRGLRYETEGGDEGPALLLLHPLGGDLRFWDSCRALWAGRYRLLAYDRPGAGATPPTPAPQTPDETMADIEALRQALHVDQLIPIGVAVGAMIAATYAGRHPAHTAALVLCNPGLRLSDAGRAMTLKRVERCRAGGIEALMPDIIDLAFNGLPQDQLYRDYSAAFQRNTALGYERTALAAMELDITAELPRIPCPVLVTVGAHDILLPPTEAKKVAALLPHPTYRELPDAAHFPPAQTPAAFAALVDEFLTAHRLAGAG